MRLRFLNKKPAKADRGITLAGAFGLLLALTLVFSLAVPALAVPQSPTWFRGEVRVANATGVPLAPPGTDVTAEIDDVPLYNWPTQLDDWGRYGYNPPTDLGGWTFKVFSDDNETFDVKEGGVEDDVVRFYIGNGIDFYIEANETGNWSSQDHITLNLTVTDSIPPAVTIDELLPDPTNDNTPEFTGTATDTLCAITLVEYRMDADVDWTPATPDDGTFDSINEDYFFTTPVLGDGTHTVYVRATDAADNTSAEVSDEFVVDTVPPTVTIDELLPDPTNDNTPEFTGTATDTPSTTIASVEYKVDDGVWMAATPDDGTFDEVSEDYFFTTPVLGDGTHTVYVRATDAADNTTAEVDYASDEFTVTTVGIVVTTNDATDITTSSATLNGSLDDLDEFTSVNVSFEWGTAPGVYTHETTPQPMTSTGDFSAGISVLASNTTHYFRAKATGSVTAYGIERSFTTDKIAPAVTTNAASDVFHNSATLNGSLDSMGDYSSVNVSFEWGTATGVYTHETTPQPMTSTDDFSAGISVLASNTTHYFRAKATGSVTVYGIERSFTTLTGPPYDFIELGEEWNLFSTPINLDPDYNEWGELVTAGGLDWLIAWSYNGQTEAWEQVLGDYVLTACDAIYVYMNSEGTVPIYPYQGISAPSKNVYTGWNLVGSAFLEVEALNVYDALISLYYAEGGHWGYEKVVSPALNQPGWTHIRDLTLYNMLIGKGYWVSMANDDIYTGDTFTPLSTP